jgi:hypothetical protein
MKRNEAVALIMDTVNATQYQDYEIGEDVAERVLRAIEEAGMLPPAHPTKGYNYVEATPTGNYDYGRRYVNEWESEDE